MGTTRRTARRDQDAHAASLAVGYLRRSTDRQEQSLADQRRAIEQFASEHGLSLVRFYTDDAISGTSTAKRFAFQEMIADAKARAAAFRYVICYDVKRFGRVDNDEAGYYRHVLKQASVEVLYASEGFAGDGTDDLLRPVKQWQARQESKDLAKVTVRGLVSKATAGGRSSNGQTALAKSSNGTHAGESTTGGWWMGGAPPFGYDLRYESQSGEFLFVLRYMRNGTKQMFNEKGKLVRTLARGESVSVSKRDRARLIPSEKQRVKVLQRIFRHYCEDGLGLKAIANALNGDKVPTPRGPEWSPHYSGRWTIGTIRAMLTNPVYTGDMVWNRRTDGRFYRIDGEGRAIERRILGNPRRLEANDERDWLIVENAHEGLVSRRIWSLAREQFQQRAEEKKQRADQRKKAEAAPIRSGAASKYLLSGLCTCSACGSRYEGNRNWTSKGGVKDTTPIYVCGGYLRSGRSTCSRGAIRRDRLEEIVIKAVLKQYGPFIGDGGRLKLTEAITDLLGGEAEQTAEKRARCERRIDRISLTVRGLLDNITEANREMVDARLVELHTEREQLEQKIKRLDAKSISHAEISGLIHDAAGFVGGLEEILGGRSETARREQKAALRRCVASIQIERKKCEARIKLRRVPVVMGGPQVDSTVTVTVKLPELREGLKPGRTARARGAKRPTGQRSK